MNRLDPELQRLFAWSQRAPKAEVPEAAPLGLSTRVASRWCNVSAPNGILVWQRAVWSTAWAAAAVIMAGLALLTVQRLQTKSTYDVSPAFQVVSTELIP